VVSDQWPVVSACASGRANSPVKIANAKLGCRTRWIRGGLLLAVVGIGTQAAASPCFNSLSKIVKTRDGRVTSQNGKPIPNAEILLKTAAREVMFKTSSQRDGTFRLEARPGKYRITVNAEGYLQFFYIVDLRYGEETQRLDVSLESNSECHDMRVVSDRDAQTEDLCRSEVVTPNLVLKDRTVLAGQVRDETGAPFKTSEVLLVSISSSDLQPPQVVATTDDRGRFAFEESEPGSYRLLASPHRGFAQAEKLDCFERSQCELDVILKTNPTDLPYASCPVR